MKPGEVIYRGSGYADLENACRARRGEEPLSPHLDFSSEDERQTPWRIFLETGHFPSAGAADMPADCMADDFWYEMLKKQAGEQLQTGPLFQSTIHPDWHLLYHLALNHMIRGKTGRRSYVSAKASDKMKMPGAVTAWPHCSVWKAGSTNGPCPGWKWD